MIVAPILAHGPKPHEQREQITEPSYDYVCSTCGFKLNYPTRLRA